MSLRARLLLVTVALVGGRAAGRERRDVPRAPRLPRRSASTSSWSTPCGGRARSTAAGLGRARPASPLSTYLGRSATTTARTVATAGSLGGSGVLAAGAPAPISRTPDAAGSDHDLHGAVDRRRPRRLSRTRARHRRHGRRHADRRDPPRPRFTRRCTGLLGRRDAGRRSPCCSRWRSSPAGSSASACVRSTGIGDTAGAIAAGDLSRAGRTGRRADRGRPARASRSNAMLAQIEAAFDAAAPLGGPSPPFRRRRLARAAHAAHVDPRLRGAVPPGRGPSGPRIWRSRWPASRPRRPGWACSSTTCCCWPGSTRAARSTGNRVDLDAVAVGGRRRARAIDPDRTIELVADDPVADRRRRLAPPSGDRQPARQRAGARAGVAGADRGLAPGRRGAAADRRPGAGPRPRGGRADLRAVHARRPVAFAGDRGCGARAIDRSGDRGGTRGRGDGVPRCGRRYGLRRSPSGRRSSRRSDPPRRIPD